jgi:hypothetical protein
MPNFNSLSTGESLIATKKGNNSLDCPEGGDASAVVGAIVAGVALSAATAVAAAASKFVADGIGTVTTAAQAAAADTLAAAQAETAALAADAKAQALAAVGFGPGGEGTAALAEGQDQLGAAQAQAQALIGEARAEVDAVIAEAAAARAAAEALISDTIAQGQALLQEGLAALEAKIASAIGAALSALPPLPAALTSPAPGAVPVPPLPVDVPILSKVIPTEVALPVPDLAIASPEGLAEGVVESVATKADVVQTAPLQEAVLSRDEIDACRDERTQIVEVINRMNTRWQVLAQRVSLSGPADIIFDPSYAIRAFLLFGGSAGNSSLINGVVGGFTQPAVSFNILRKGFAKFSETTRETLQIGPLAGSKQWQEVRDQVENVANFTGECSVLPPISSAVVAQEGLFNSTMAQFEDALIGENFVENNAIEEVVTEIERIIPLWQTLTGILLDIQASSLSIEIIGFEGEN